MKANQNFVGFQGQKLGKFKKTLYKVYHALTFTAVS